MINLQEHCFVEQNYYQYEIVQHLINDRCFEKNICTKMGDEVKFNVTGFVFANNEILIVFPKGYVLPPQDAELRKHARVLLNVLIRYMNEVSLTQEENELLGSPNSSDPEGIAAATWLIRDYLESGYIRKEMRRNTVGNGANIDWTKTVRHKIPVLSGGNPVYFNYYIKNRNQDYDNMLYKLHMYAVRKSYKKYGWLISDFDSEEMLENLEMPCDRYTAGHILQKELESTFVERELLLIKNIREFLMGSSNENYMDRLSTMATSTYYTVWEAICGFAFRNEYKELKCFLPQPEWHLKGNQKKDISQRPDILFRYGDQIYILDAKYYDVQRNLPGWHDLVKQFYYHYSLGVVFPSIVIKNVLVFPNSKDSLVEYIGYVEIKNTPVLGRVEGFCINTYRAMCSYVNYRTEEFRTELIKILN